MSRDKKGLSKKNPLTFSCRAIPRDPSLTLGVTKKRGSRVTKKRGSE
jgi:hypothetical protein